MKISAKKPLRLWPAWSQWCCSAWRCLLCPSSYPGNPVAFFGGLIGGLAVVVWWLFFSRAVWPERLGAIVVMIVAVFATSRIVHVSIAKGAMGMLFPVLAIPALSVAFVAWAVATRRLSDGLRRATMIATILLACEVWTLVRTGGFSGD